MVAGRKKASEQSDKRVSDREWGETGNQISSAGARALGEALQHNHAVKKVYLYCTKLQERAKGEGVREEAGHGGTEPLGRMVRGASGLGQTGNRIGDAGAEALAEALLRNNALKLLGLRATIGIRQRMMEGAGSGGGEQERRKGWIRC